MGEVRVWSVFDAKNRLSEVIDLAHAQGPQMITEKGQPSAVILSVEDYEKLKHPKMPLNDFLRTAPLEGIELIRDNGGWREVEL